MRNIAMTLVLLLLSSGVLAQELTCIDKLLPYSRHSGLHHLDKSEWNDGKDVLDAEGAKKAMFSLVESKLLCKRGDVTIEIHPVCSTLIADTPQSNTCFIFTNLGYFFVAKDNGKNTNLIFSKDKRFSPLP